MDVNYLFTMYFPLLSPMKYDASLFRENETILYTKNVKEIETGMKKMIVFRIYFTSYTVQENKFPIYK